MALKEQHSSEGTFLVRFIATHFLFVKEAVTPFFSLPLSPSPTLHYKKLLSLLRAFALVGGRLGREIVLVIYLCLFNLKI